MLAGRVSSTNAPQRDPRTLGELRAAILDGVPSPRKKALVDEHRAQRADLGALLEACAKGEGPPAELAMYAHRLATSLLADMAAEEKTFEFLDGAPQAPIERRIA